MYVGLHMKIKKQRHGPKTSRKGFTAKGYGLRDFGNGMRNSTSSASGSCENMLWIMVAMKIRYVDAHEVPRSAGRKGSMKLFLALKFHPLVI